MREFGLEPVEPYPGGSVPWHCICVRCGTATAPKLQNLHGERGGCNTCGYRKAWERRRQDKPIDHVAVMQTVGLVPLEPYPGPRKAWLCRCTRCNHEVSPSYCGIQGGKKGCVWCARQRISVDTAVATMNGSGLDPIEPYVSALRPWRCICRGCGQEVSPAYANIQRGQGGCGTCATYGTDWNLPGFVYVATNEALKAHKIGIRNVGSVRLDRLRRRGWSIYNEHSFPLTADAVRVEQAVLRWWRKELGQPPYLCAADMPTRGWTETVSADAVSLPDVWSKVLELAAA